MDRLSSGAYLVDEHGFILEDMHDRDVRTRVWNRAPFVCLRLSFRARVVCFVRLLTECPPQVHVLIKQMLSPLVSDTVKIDKMEESKVILRIRAPSFAKDARR